MNLAYSWVPWGRRLRMYSRRPRPSGSFEVAVGVEEDAAAGLGPAWRRRGWCWPGRGRVPAFPCRLRRRRPGIRSAMSSAEMWRNPPAGRFRRDAAGRRRGLLGEVDAGDIGAPAAIDSARCRRRSRCRRLSCRRCGRCRRSSRGAGFDLVERFEFDSGSHQRWARSLEFLQFGGIGVHEAASGVNGRLRLGRLHGGWLKKQKPCRAGLFDD